MQDTVECPMCQKAVVSQKINMHLDSGCKRHLAKTVTSTAPLDPKGKQKQQWSKLLGGAGASTTGTKGKEKGKSKSRFVESAPLVCSHRVLTMPLQSEGQRGRRRARTPPQSRVRHPPAEAHRRTAERMGPSNARREERADQAT